MSSWQVSRFDLKWDERQSKWRPFNVFLLRAVHQTDIEATIRIFRTRFFSFSSHYALYWRCEQAAKYDECASVRKIPLKLERPKRETRASKSEWCCLHTTNYCENFSRLHSTDSSKRKTKIRDWMKLKFARKILERMTSKTIALRNLLNFQ